MDTLALLCNLHADGPASVRRLRRAGCRDLADLERLSPEALAAALGTTPAMARRFAVEGRHLARRARAEPAEDEAPELGDVERELLAPAAPAALRYGAATTPSSAPRATDFPDTLPPLEPPPARTAATPPAPLGATPSTPAPASTSPGTTPPSPAWSGAWSPSASSPNASSPSAWSPSVGPTSPPHPDGAAGASDVLHADLVEGLDAAWCRDLATAGVTTLAQLADADGLALARRLGRSLPALLDLGCLAHHALRAGDGELATARSTAPRAGAATTASSPLPGIASISAPIHSTEHLFPKSRASASEAAGPFA